MDNGEVVLAGTIADDALIAVANAAEKRIEAVNRIKRLALRVTSKEDWVDMGGTPYMSANGCRKIARLFGVSWTSSPPERVSHEGGHFSYRYTGEFSLGSATIQEVGERGSRDPFFSRSKGQDIPPAEIDEGNVMKAAYTNLLNRGLKSLLGLGGLTWDDLSGTEVKQGSTPSVQYKEGKKPLSEAHNKLWELLKDYNNGDKEQMKLTLHSLTSWTGNDGKYHEGKQSLYDISEKMAGIAYSKLKDLKEKMDAEMDEGLPPAEEVF